MSDAGRRAGPPETGAGSVSEHDGAAGTARPPGTAATGAVATGTGATRAGATGAGATGAGASRTVATGAAGSVLGPELRRMLAAGELDLPLPGAGRTAGRWAALAAWGGRDLSLARLGEGHVDALAILAEAGRRPVPDALYGVWASRSGGAALRMEREGDACVLRGTMRFCSGARTIDRALVVADADADADADVDSAAPTERLLLDVDVRQRGITAVAGSWCTAAMADADTLDVVVDGLPVGADDEVGEPGWYVARPGFALGGAGVAAVWWGGAAGVLDRVLAHLGAVPDRHALAHVGELHAALAATDALLDDTAAMVDADRGTVRTTERRAADVVLAVTTVRAAVERAAREVLDRAPRIVGPGPLSRDDGLARALADLALYVRQHHAERDHAALGERVVDQWRAR